MSESLITKAAIAVIISLLLSRYHEQNADAFAYTHGDDNALAGGIAFFESKMIDPLFGIEKVNPYPYLDTDSTVGAIARSIVSAVEAPIFYLGKK